MPILVTEWRNVKSCLSRVTLGPILSILGAALAISCIVMGFYHLAAIFAGLDLILTRLALGVKGSKKDTLIPGR